MDLRNITSRTLTYDDELFLEIVATDIQSYITTLNSQSVHKIVLLFPPVNNFRRFLIHQLVKQNFHNEKLTTLSIGSLYARRTVIFPNALKLGSEKNTRNTSIAGPAQDKEKIHLNTSTYRMRKVRKPDKQIYVPRGRRMLQTQDKSHENIDFDIPIDLTSHLNRNKNTCEEVSNTSSNSNEFQSHNVSVPIDLVHIEKSIESIPEISSIKPNDDDETTFECISLSSNSVCDNKNVCQIVNLTNDSELSHNTEKIDLNIQCIETHPSTSLSTEVIDLDPELSGDSDDCVIVDDRDSPVVPVTSSVNSTNSESSKISVPTIIHLGDVSVVSNVDVQTSVEENLKNVKKKSKSKSKAESVNVADCDWEDLFDDSGDFVNKSLVEELMSAIGKVNVKPAVQDYRPFQTEEERSSDGECIIEIHGFPADFKTDDLHDIFARYRVDQGFQIIWVDDTHALAVFSSPLTADEVLNTELPFIKTRPLKNAISKSRMKAQSFVLPPAARPKTCVSLARRLVSGHLGMKINVTDKQREAEKKLLSDAREKRKQITKQKFDVWEGTSSGHN